VPSDTLIDLGASRLEGDLKNHILPASYLLMTSVRLGPDFVAVIECSFSPVAALAFQGQVLAPLLPSFFESLL
jgi:hypothetical protein